MENLQQTIDFPIKHGVLLQIFPQTNPLKLNFKSLLLQIFHRLCKWRVSRMSNGLVQAKSKLLNGA
jgi:hypothetical protein